MGNLNRSATGGQKPSLIVALAAPPVAAGPMHARVRRLFAAGQPCDWHGTVLCAAAVEAAVDAVEEAAVEEAAAWAALPPAISSAVCKAPPPHVGEASPPAPRRRQNVPAALRCTRCRAGLVLEPVPPLPAAVPPLPVVVAAASLLAAPVVVATALVPAPPVEAEAVPVAPAEAVPEGAPRRTAGGAPRRAAGDGREAARHRRPRLETEGDDPLDGPPPSPDDVRSSNKDVKF